MDSQNDIRDRIRIIIDRENLSQADFCRETNINTSTLSHVLTGRNNPSTEVINKILTAFPKYNSLWLMNGQGEPTIEDPVPGSYSREEIRIPSAQSHQFSLFGEQKEMVKEEYYSPDTVAKIPSGYPHDSALERYSEHVQHTNNPMLSHPDILIRSSQKNKAKITKIIVYYDDDTFESFLPEK